MFRWLKLSAALLTALVLVPGDVLAQVPKSDSKTWYEDDSKFGFKVKVPTDWDFVPPQPGETSLIGKYDPPHNKYITIGRDEVLWLHAYLVVFDRRPKPEDEEEILEDDEGTTITITWDREYRDIADWVGDKLNGVNWRQIEEDKLKVRGLEATEHVFEATGRSKDRPPIRAYAAVYRVSPEIDIALVFNGPGDKKKWKSYQKAFEKMAKSFKQVEVTATEITPESLPANASPRDKKRAKLIDEMRRVPGWELYETPNYLIISNNDDEDFLEELMERVEKIREIFEDDYPPEKARRAAKEPNSMRVDDDGSGDGGGDGGDGDDEAEEDEGLRSVSVQADPFEQSRASVIRVCKDQAQYHSYGGPGGSAGYWSSRDEELVIFDDKAGGGRADTWAVLNHEAFHQYIFYFYGELAPHSWYNEGTGDFYAGYYYQHKKFKLKPFIWRVGTVKEMIRTGKYVPLKEIVRYSQGQYYGSSEYGTSGGHHYAQGWSFIYFMRTGPKKSRKWNEAWDHILQTYLDTLAETGDLDRAVDVAFEGVDWDELEEAWKDYIG